MPTVYIPNLAGHDYSDAKRYGEVVFVSAGTQDKYAVNNMYRMWQEALKDSKPEDMIVSTGLSVMSIIGCSLFAHKHGRVNLLLWLNNKYIKREVVFNQ